jgi:ABC-type sugar transport system substrate-binding protein
MSGHLWANRQMRALAAGAALTLVLGTSACAATAGTSTSTSTANDAAKVLKSIEMINPSPGDPEFQTIAGCFTAEAKRKGVAAKVVGSPGDNLNSSAALGYVQQAVADGVGAIALTTSGDATSIEPALAAARKKGVLVATMESGDATAARNFDVGIDIVQYAKNAAAQIAAMPGRKDVAILTIALSGTPKIFDDAFIQAIKSDPSVSLLDVVPDNGDVTTDADLAGEILLAHPQTNVILTVNPSSTPGVATAITEHNDVGKVHLVGLSLTPEGKSALQSGIASALYVQRICDVGTLAVEDLLAVAAGKTVPSEVPIAATFATKADYTKFGPGWN